VKSTSFGHPGDLLRILEKPSNTDPELNTMDVDAVNGFRVAFAICLLAAMRPVN
jgi:hypothetical protein